VGVIIAEMMAKVKGSVLPSMRGDKIIRGSFVLLKGTDYSQQLRLTMRTLGSPAEDSDLAFIESKNAVEYIKAFEKKEMRYPRIKWSDMFPTLPSDALDLLDKALHFNPKKRLTVSEALSHPWLSDYHNAAEERDSSLISETEWSWDRLPRGMLTKSTIQKLVLDEIQLFDTTPRLSSSSTTTSRLTTGAVPRAHLSRVTSFTENTSFPLPSAAAVVIPAVGILPKSSSSSSTAVSIASLNTQRIAASTTLSSESVKPKIVSFSGSAIPTRNTPSTVTAVTAAAAATAPVQAVAAAAAPVQVVTVSVSTNPTRQALQPVVMSVNRTISGEVSASTVKDSMIKESGGMKKDSLLTTSSTSRRPVIASATGTGITSISASMNSGGSVVPPPPSKLAPKAPLMTSSSISLNDSVIVNALTGQINALKADLLTILDYRMKSFTLRLDSIEKRLDDKKTTETETLETDDKE
jgi:serine/threonine protein kinase